MSEGLRKYSDSKSDSVLRERSAFSEHINTLLEEYEDLTDDNNYLPLNGMNLLEKLRDGVVLAYLIHHLWPGNINLKKIVRGVKVNDNASNAPLSPNSNATLQKAVFIITSNLNCVLDAAKQCKLVVVNIGAGDVMGMNEDLVLGLVWQIIRAGLLRGVDLVVHPELVRLLGPDESLKDFMSGMKPETLLLRWFNFHLKKAESTRVVTNWGRDLQDSSAFLILLDQLFTHRYSQPLTSEISEILERYPTDSFEDRLGRAGHVLNIAAQFGLDGAFVTPIDIAQGHPRLTMALAAALFNCHIGISLPSEDDITVLRQERDDLQIQLAHLRSLLESASRISSSQYEDLARENSELKQAIEKERINRKEEVEKLTSEFQAYREELAAQYKDSLESSISGERRAHQEELIALNERQNSLFKLILTQSSLLHRHVSKDPLLATSNPLKAVIEAFKTLNIKTNVNNTDIFDGVKIQNALVPPEDWLSINFELIEAIAKRNRELNELSNTLQKAVVHKEHVNEVMGAKIREFTEEYIKNKSQDNGERSERANSITRMFSFRK